MREVPSSGALESARRQVGMFGKQRCMLVSRTLVFDRFRLNLRTRELLRVAEDGSETPIPLGLRTTYAGTARVRRRRTI